MMGATNRHRRRVRSYRIMVPLAPPHEACRVDCEMMSSTTEMAPVVEAQNWPAAVILSEKRSRFFETLLLRRRPTALGSSFRILQAPVNSSSVESQAAKDAQTGDTTADLVKGISKVGTTSYPRATPA